jgi:phosphoenolpyruvate synthase/pyruvate phosphate dikinase
LTFEPGDDSIGGTPLLSLAQQLFLCAEAKRIGDFFGLPVDLEFAIMNEELYLLQARPVTEIMSQVKIA